MIFGWPIRMRVFDMETSPTAFISSSVHSNSVLSKLDSILIFYFKFQTINENTFRCNLQIENTIISNHTIFK